MANKLSVPANINYTNLRQLDLNLLIALDVLVTEASVTKAAAKLNMSQSAMSHSLKRLRTILNDDILIRTSKEMEVTPYGREIGDRIRQILTDIESTLLSKETFNPATAQETFRIAASDYAALLPQRMAQQYAKAMNLNLLPPPIEIEGFTVSMVWHQRKTNIPQHQWLREQVIDTTKNI